MNLYVFPEDARKTGWQVYWAVWYERLDAAVLVTGSISNPNGADTCKRSDRIAPRALDVHWSQRRVHFSSAGRWMLKAGLMRGGTQIRCVDAGAAGAGVCGGGAQVELHRV